ncbi:ABC transporter permease [Listeria kieliensis]|uniref:ABC transporter permease n=1 Tax=Listeria kieliensis TaxID=1621700 RepID=A0A3D8TQ64_9LIST|nr:ABC transporter permease [Listeria kieliensis]
MKKFDSVELFKKRFSSYTDELNKYLRYMFNDHLLFVLIIGIGAGIFYYADWVKHINPSFPAIPLMVVLLTASLCFASMVTLLKRPDTVYLTVKETEMLRYFERAKRVTIALQSYLFAIILLVAMPMYTAVTGYHYSRFIGLVILLVVLKAWNVYVGFETAKLDNNDSTWLFFRVFVTALMVYLLLAFSFWWTIPVVLIALLVSYYLIRGQAKGKVLRFEYLVDKEEARMNRFYRLVNLFTDVPHLKGTVRRRSYLDFLYKPIPYAKRKTFAYLFSRTFVRTNEYIGLYARLTVIALILLIFVQGFYLNIIFSLLFIYLTGFQFIPMLRHFDGQMMLRLYPIQDAIRNRSFIHFIRILLVFQALLFGIVGIAQNGSIGGLVILGINLIFVIAFSFLYIPFRVKKIYQ